MGTLYSLLTGFSIVGIKVVDIILSLIFDGIAFTLAWKIGKLGANGKMRSLFHWTSRIGIYAILMITTQAIF